MIYCSNKILIPLFFVFSLAGNAQPQKYQLHEISEGYKGHDAVVLSSKDCIKIDFDKKNKLRIKNSHSQETYFLTNNTKLYSDEYITYSSFNDVKNLNAFLYEFDNGKYKKKSASNIVQQDDFSSYVFYDDNKSVRVVYPSITKESVSSLSYDEYFNDPHVLTNFYFSSYIPVDKAEVSIEFPVNISVKYKLFNDNGLVQFTEERNKKTVKYTWKARKISKYDSREEDFNISFYEPHVCLYISDYTVKNKKIEVLSDVKKLYDWYYSLSKNVNKQDVPGLKTLVDSLVTGKKTEYEKAKAIFYWVQTNIKYVAIENGYSGLIPRDAKDVFQRRYGDCKDMSSIQNKMYTYAGLESHLVWIGTRDLPYTYEELPTGSVDNHMIAVVKIDGKYYFTDGTAYFISIDFPSDAIQGKEALIGIDSTHFEVYKVPIVEKEKNKYVEDLQLSIVGDSLKGTGKISYSGYFMFDMNIDLIRTPENKWKELLSKKLSKGSNKCKLDSYNVDSIDRDKNLNIDYSFTLPSYMMKAGNSYYVNLNLDKNLQNDKVDTSKQKFDKKFEFRNCVNYKTTLKIPIGYKIVKIPQSSDYKNKYFGFDAQYKYDEKKQSLFYSFNIYIDTLAVESSNFEQWNDMIKKLGEVYAQVVELERTK